MLARLRASLAACFVRRWSEESCRLWCRALLAFKSDEAEPAVDVQTRRSQRLWQLG